MDVDDHPVSPTTLDDVLAAGEGVQVVVVDARTTHGRAWLGDSRVRVVTGAAELSSTELRIVGAQATDAPIVAFVDARAELSRGWIDAVVRQSADGDVVAVTGAIEGVGEPTLSFTGSVGQFHPAATRVHDVLFPLPELAIFRRSAIDDIDGFDRDLPWPHAVVGAAWRLRLLGRRSVLDPAISGSATCRCQGDPYAGLELVYTCLGEDALELVLPAAFVVAAGDDASGSATKPVDRFLERFGELRSKRDAVQRARAVDDSDILPLLLAALEPPRFDRGGEHRYRDVVERQRLHTLFEERQRVLVVTPDIFTTRMAGPAIRAWQIAEALADRHVVTLASTASICEVTSPRFDVVAPDDHGLRRIAKDATVVVAQGFAMEGRPYLKAEDKVVIVDIYDPLHLEQLELFRDETAEKRRVTVREATRVLNEQLVRGDFFVCASSKQRDFWLGQLAALGRLNHRTYDDGARFERLVATVPFGVPDAPPVKTGAAIKRVTPGIGDNDKVVLWAGGIYNWFDPLTLIRAIDRVKDRVPEVRLFFMGLRHPNPEVSEMRVSTEARRLARELRLTDQYVFFNEGWVPYEDRQNFLLEASIGVSTHLDHVETEFSFRTRILDYIWAAVPIVATKGDWFADFIEAEQLGLTVPAIDVVSVEAALLRILEDDAFATRCRANIEGVRERFHWPQVLEPMTSFCRSPRRAADLSDLETRATLWASDADRLADWLRHQPKGFDRLRRILAEW